MGESSNALLSASAQIQDFECIHASYINVSNIVSVKLSGSRNYLLWKAQMCCLMESNNMRGIVDATFVGSSVSGWENMKQYDSLVKGWIFGSVTEHVLADVFDLDTARDVWDKLKSIYDPGEPTWCLPEDLLVKRLTDVRRTKSEVYEGFSHVFCDESTQVKRLTDVRRTKSEVYEGVSHVFCDESTQVKRLTDVRRTKSEVYEGFSHVFCDESTQNKLTPIFWLPEKVYLLGESRNWLWRR
ncbi:hypothetical protein HanPI659440_Chr09g0324131 [Helianthus annuus]|nr:hypothetical protein HanPI659440_Chr09g0324131 [Helianthus annuus]